MPFRPEEVEEEGGAEDGRYHDSDEDVVGSYSNVVVIVYCSEMIQMLDEGLLVDVVYKKLSISSDEGLC